MKAIYVIPLLLFLVSCIDVLDKKPLDEFSETDVWSDPYMVELVVNEAYDGIETWVTGGMAPSSMVDDVFSNFNWSNERTVTHGLLNADNSENVSMIYNKGDEGRWAFYYKKIRSINQFFMKIDNVPTEDLEFIDRMKGEMYFLRAYFYSELVNFYGGVPILNQVYDVNSQDYNVEKSSYNDCVNYIAEQLDSSIALLPYYYSAENLGRATKGTAMALKAQELLYAASPLYNNGSYNDAKLLEAKSASEALIYLQDDGGQQMYSLYSPNDYRDIFLDHDNSEVIFAKYVNDDQFVDRENTLSRDLGPNSIHGYSAYNPLQQLVDAFEVVDNQDDPTQSVVPATYENSQRNVISSSLYDDQNPYVLRDPRFYADLLFDGAVYKNTNTIETYIGGKDSPQGNIEAWNASKSGYLVRKFTSENEAVFVNVKENIMWILYRLSELYLNEAEILNELGTTDAQGHDAAYYINMIRQRACVNMPAYSSVDREIIRHERQVELCFEGNRYYDVRRWQIYDQVLGIPALGIQIEKLNDGTKTYQIDTVDNLINFDSRIYYLPIPSSEIQKDPTMGQSIGW